MKTTLILLKDGRNILVSDEKIKQNDWLINGSENYQLYFAKTIFEQFYNTKNDKKVIAVSFNHPSLLRLTYSDEVKQALRDKYGWVDIEELSKEEYAKVISPPSILDENVINEISFRLGINKGFKAHQSITNKMFSLDDIRKAFDAGAKRREAYLSDRTYGVPNMEEYVQQLQQPIQLNVEVEQENKQLYCDVCDDILVLNRRTWNCIRCKTEHIHRVQHKITNNSIHILKILD